MAHNIVDADITTSLNSESYLSRLNNSDDCFVADITVPLKIADLPTSPQPVHISNEQALDDFIERSDHNGFNCRVISICQKNTWAPLQVTKEMLSKLVKHHKIDPSFLEVPLSFYRRKTEQEHGFCVPWTLIQTDTYYESFYTIRYPEFKGNKNEPWVIRQTGVYHKYNIRNRTSLWILVNPNPQSKAQQHVFSCFDNANCREQLKRNPWWLHSVIHAAYLPNWREYLKAYENILLPITNTTTATFIEEPLRVHHDKLGTLIFLQGRFLPVSAIVENFVDVLEGLKGICKELVEIDGTAGTAQTLMIRRIDNYFKQCATFRRNAKFLQQRSHITAQLLSDTIAFKNQGFAQEQNNSMLRLTKSTTFFSVLGLLYLPWTLTGTFFGMNFFSMDAKHHRLVASPMIWIYIFSSIGLTVATFLLYYWVARRNGDQSPLAPKINEKRDWIQLSTFKRRLTGGSRRTMSIDA